MWRGREHCEGGLGGSTQIRNIVRGVWGDQKKISTTRKYQNSAGSHLLSFHDGFLPKKFAIDPPVLKSPKKFEIGCFSTLKKLGGGEFSVYKLFFMYNFFENLFFMYNVFDNLKTA